MYMYICKNKLEETQLLVQKRKRNEKTLNYLIKNLYIYLYNFLYNFYEIVFKLL